MGIKRVGKLRKEQRRNENVRLKSCKIQEYKNLKKWKLTLKVK